MVLTSLLIGSEIVISWLNVTEGPGVYGKSAESANADWSHEVARPNPILRIDELKAHTEGIGMNICRRKSHLGIIILREKTTMDKVREIESLHTKWEISLLFPVPGWPETSL